MHRISYSLALLFLSISFMKPLLAQQKPGEKTTQNFSRLEMESRFVQSDSLSRFQTIHTTNSRQDVETGVTRALYRIDAPAAFSGSSERSALFFLNAQADRFGFSQPLDDLELISLVDGRYSSHASFQQTFSGLPVYNRQVKVNLDRAGRPTMVLSGYAPHLKDVRGFQPQPALASNAALERVRVLLDAPAVHTSSPQLLVYPEQSPRLVWQIFAWPESPAIELELLIDANDGTLVQARPTSTHMKSVSGSLFLVPGSRNPRIENSVNNIAFELTRNKKQETKNQKLSSRHSTLDTRHSSLTSGRGFVFDPDPLSVSGLFYGDAFSDNSDGDTPALNDQRAEVDLLDINPGNDGLYRLNGPYVQIVGESAGGTLIYTPPAESSPDGFRYTRSNDFFEAVNAYYHIDKSQRYLQSLDVGRDIQNLSLRVNPHGLGIEDNSRYYSNQNFIGFGTGGVDDAEDAHVIWHEYGHALLEWSAPGLLSGDEGKALHEGWADYWAASYARSLVEESAVQRSDWRTLFNWDSGDGSIWPGREMVSSGKYPDDIFCDEGGFQCDIYNDGVLWASTLMQVYDAFGRTITDRLSLASHSYLLHPVTFRDAAEAIIQADADIYNGEHVDFLIQTFNDRGLIDLNSFGPLALHEALPATEQLGGVLPVSIEATGISAPVDRVFMVYTHENASPVTVDLSLSGDNIYTGDLPLPSTTGTVTYYAIVRDELGLEVRLPASPAGGVYSFAAGPDNEPPTIQHTSLPSIALIDWPAHLNISVNDNLGVDTVVVEFYIDGPLGDRISEGEFGLTLDAGRYRGVFPVSVDDLDPGSTVFYNLLARDKSMAANEIRLPEDNYFFFSIILENGIFRKYDFETALDGFDVDALWERGVPAHGLNNAHSGEAVWGTLLGAAYPETAGRFGLEIPPLNLQGLGEAYLVFWHWFDMEHDGDAFPESAPESVLWDGGNVKISQDDGVTWEVLQPASGYNGTIAQGRENPMAGEPAFGGYSYGWRQVVAPLPTSNVRLRFDFGTDSGNDLEAVQYAGWYLDDISILVSAPEDTQAPTVNLQPAMVSVRDPGQPPPSPFAELSDDTGIASVIADYQIFTDAGTQQKRVRLDMDRGQSNLFSAEFPDAEATTFIVGDSITYRLSVSDFAGNTNIFPPNSEPPYRIEYRLREAIDLLALGQSSGLWKPVADDWVVTADNEKQQPISSLVFGPLDLPANVDNLQLLLFFAHELDPEHGGNLKISTDGAESWEVVQPVGGYNATLPADAEVPASMQNQEVFTGSRPNLQQAQFDLLDRKGSQIWLRVDFAAQDALSAREFWRLQEATLSYSTLEAVNGGFDIPLEFTLHANFPDPFSSTTTLSYTISEASAVLLDVYDILGRRIDVLVDQVQQAGTHTLNYDGSRLASGLYLIRLVTNQGQKVERVVVN